MSNLIADDHYAVTLGSLFGIEDAARRMHPAVRKRCANIAKSLKLSGFGEGDRLGKVYTMISKHFALERKAQQETNTPMRLSPDNEIVGNYAVWFGMRKLIKHRVGVITPEKQIWLRVRSNVENSILSANYRSAKGGLGKNALLMDTSAVIDHLTTLPTLDAIISEKMKKARSRFNFAYKKWAQTGYDERETPKFDFDGGDPFRGVAFLSFGPVMIMKVANSIIALPEPHTHKLLSLIKSWTSILFMLPSTSYRYQPLDLMDDYLDAAWGIISSDVDFLGEVVKGSRGIAVSRFDTSNIIGVNMYQSTLAAMKPSRREYAVMILNFFSSQFRDREDVVNILNIYKAVPHPDTNLNDAFQTIVGLSDPNRVDPDVLPRFRGTLRRAIYRSMATSSHDVRLVATTNASAALADEANKTQRSIAAVCERSATAWSDVRFQVVRTVTKPADIVLTPSDKSSQKAPDFSEDDLEDCMAWARGEGSDRQPDFSKEAHTINDAANHLKGEGGLNTKKSIKRFERVVALHEAFEARYPGMSPEEIPEDELREFVLRTPGARYLVGTEPKLGEFHKKVTRIFYMAEQELKTITQITERVARQISRKQNGVSIVKGYSGRRRDLEQFAAAVSGPDAEKQSIYVSFDMSEFSKRFPMALVREYGKILAEVTGEEWMARIDLVFRAAVVIHNTRGYFNWLSGVKGGFEGFLNFVWSSIHAAIMEVALKSTGLSGMILTYSDDGLLLFYSPVRFDPQDNYTRVMRIQETYAKHGLVFHLGKTMVSSEVWEYLGDMCHNGHLLPMWFKEITSVGILKSSRGLSPLRMRISSFEGQVAAAVSAGANPLAAYVLLRFICSTYLSNFMMHDDNRANEALLIVPVALGGMRIRSPMELCMGSDIDVVAEFIADLEGLMRMDAPLYKAIAAHLQTVVNGVKPSASRVLMGNLLSSSLPDTSGIGVLMEAIEMIKSSVPASLSGAIGSHPITPVIDRLITDALAAVENIDHRALSSLTMALPPWIKFTKAMALVRGSGAIRLIKRGDLRKLQYEDSKRCREAFSAWRLAINSGDMITISPYDAVHRLISRVNAGLNLHPLKRSIRSVLSLDKNEGSPVIQVRYSPHSTGNPSTLDYVEPRVQFPSDNSALHWFSEATGDVEISSARKFQAVCASFLSYSPESLPFLRYLGNIFRTAVPALPPGITRAFHRRTAQLGVATDVRVAMPKAFWALSAVNYVGDALGRIRTLRRADRVTHLEGARILSFFASLRDKATGAQTTSEVKVFTLYGNVDQISDNCVKREMTMLEIPQHPYPELDVDQRTQMEFQASINEALVTVENAESLEEMAWNVGQDDIEDLTAVIMISINSMTRWIHDVVMSGTSAILPMRSLPSVPAMRSLVLRKSVASAMWHTLDPRIRGLAGSCLRDVVTAHGAGLANLRPEVSEALNYARQHLDSILRMLYDLGHGVVNAGELDKVAFDLRDIVEVISECVLSTSVFSQDRVVVVRPASGHPGYMTDAHRVAFKKVFSASVTALTAAMAGAQWNQDIVPVLVGLHLNPDDVLDWLNVCRPLLRASSHRTTHHPYNRTSALIQMSKFYMSLRNIENLGITDDAQALNFIRTNPLSAHQRAQLQRNLERGRDPLGADHRAMLASPIEEEVHNRFMQHFRELRRGRRYGTYENNNIGVLLQWLRPSLTAYYELIILRAIGLIIEVPTSFVNQVEALPHFTPYATTLLSGVQMVGDHFSGEEIGDGVIERAQPIVQLLSAHIGNFCTKTGLTGLSVLDTDPMWLRSTMVNSGYFDAEGGRIMRVANNVQCAAMFTCRRFRRAEAAFATFVTLSRFGTSSMSLIKNPRDNLYYLIGVFAPRPTVALAEDDPNLEIDTDEPVDAFIPLITFTAEAEITQHSLGQLARRFASRDEGGIFYQAVAAHARMMNMPQEVNNASIYLQAAMDISRDDHTSMGKLWAYTLLLHFMRGNENDDAAVLTYRRLRAVLNQVGHQARGMMVLDISLASTWMRTARIFPGDNISFDRIGELINLRPALAVNVDIAPSATFQRVMTLEQILTRRNEEGFDVAPGQVMAALVVIEQLAIMGPGEEDDAEIQADDVDLDNFW
jgi:hypothetical protein